MAAADSAREVDERAGNSGSSARASLARSPASLKRPWSKAWRARKRSSQAFGLVVVMLATGALAPPGAPDGHPELPAGRRAQAVDEVEDRRLARGPVAQREDVLVVERVEGPHLDDVGVAELPDRREEERAGAGLPPDLARERLVDALDVVLPELLQDVEHPAAGEDAELGSLLERGDEEAEMPSSSVSPGLVGEVGDGNGGAAAGDLPLPDAPGGEAGDGEADEARTPWRRARCGGARRAAPPAGERSEAPRARPSRPSAAPPDPRKAPPPPPSPPAAAHRRAAARVSPGLTGSFGASHISSVFGPRSPPRPRRRRPLHRPLPGEHLPQHHPRRPDVGPLVDHRPRRLLRRHVGRRPGAARPLGPEQVGEAEVEQLHPPVLADEDVRGLQGPCAAPPVNGRAPAPPPSARRCAAPRPRAADPSRSASPASRPGAAPSPGTRRPGTSPRRGWSRWPGGRASRPPRPPSGSTPRRPGASTAPASGP